MSDKQELDNISNDLYNVVFYFHSKVFNPSSMLKGMPLPPSNMRVIFHLTRLGPSPVSKIANELSISKPNMTPIIDNLIAEGFVNRYNDPNDRRIIMVEATENAYSFLKKKEQYMKSMLSEKIAILDDDDLAALKALLPKMFKIISKIK